MTRDNSAIARLRQWRKASGYTQAKAAAYFAIPLTTYQSYEWGTRVLPPELANKTLLTPSGAPPDAPMRHGRKPFPDENLAEYMKPEKGDRDAGSMDRWVTDWGGWFTIQFEKPGGWHPTLWRGSGELVDDDMRMPLVHVPSVYPHLTLEGSLRLARADRWRAMIAFYAQYEVRILNDMRRMQAEGRW